MPYSLLEFPVAINLLSPEKTPRLITGCEKKGQKKKSNLAERRASGVARLRKVWDPSRPCPAAAGQDPVADARD